MAATTYQHYEDRYKKQFMPVEFVEKLRPILISRGIESAEIDKLVSPPSNFEGVAGRVVDAPLISWVQAGGLSEVVDPYAVGDAERFFPIPYERETIFLLRVRGNSMADIAPDSSIIVVDYSLRELLPGKRYIIKVDGEATFKKYQGRPECFVPETSEEGHSIVPMSDKIEVVGRVVRVMADI